jgi:hypothetical protein
VHAVIEISKYKSPSLDKIPNLKSTTNNSLLLHMPFSRWLVVNSEGRSELTQLAYDMDGQLRGRTEIY